MTPPTTAPDSAAEWLETRRELCQANLQLQALAEENRQLKSDLAWLREQIRLGQSRRFAPSSETTSQEMLQLFNEAETQADAAVAEPTLETAVRRVPRARGKRDAQLANLQTEIVRHEVPEAERACPQCSALMEEMGADITRKLKIVPVQIWVVEHHKIKYACRCCAKHATTTPIVSGVMTDRFFPGSLAAAGTAACIAHWKYELGLPLYRIEKTISDRGVELGRATLANWMLRGAQVLAPYHARLRRELLERPILHADETTVQVLHEAGRAASSKSYMWVYCSGRDGPQMVLYDYQETRAHGHARDFLQGFKGYVHSDGYQAYDTLPEATGVGCWAHVRRGFVDAIKVLGHADRKQLTPAHEGLAFCNRLYQIEREGSAMSAPERLALRQAKSQPVLEAMRSWLQATGAKVTPRSALGEAIGYSLQQWPKLSNFLLDGRLEIDNNRCERAIKPFVIGRKNWLFSNTARGARASAMLYSMVETAKANDLVPLEYLTLLFEALPNVSPKDTDALTALLPWSESVQRRCSKIKSKRA